jgi:gluconokinase
MGVGGSGKTTVGTLLANHFRVPHVDADTFHPSANVEKMRSGRPLDDEDRRPWLRRIAEHLTSSIAAGNGVVVGCSALKRRYRDVLAVDPAVSFVHLHGTPDVVRARMQARTGHFFGTALIDSQFADLEPLAADEPGVVVGIEQRPDEIVAAAVAALAELWTGKKRETEGNAT